MDEVLTGKWKNKLTDLKLLTKLRPVSVSLQELTDKFKPPLSWEQQLDFLSLVPNSHYNEYLRLKSKNVVCSRFPKLHNHLLYNPKNDELKNNNNAPTSFRQRTLYFLSKNYVDYVMRSINLKLSQEPIKKRPPLQTPKEKRRRKSKKIELTNTSPGISPEPVINQYELDNGYDIYKEQMLLSGVLIVRNFSQKGGRLIMNDYETKRATILMDNFVLVQYTYEPNDSIDFECICKDYKKTAGEGGTDLDPEGKWMGKENRCMHIRLLCEFFMESLEQIPKVQVEPTGILAHLQNQLHDSCVTSANTEIAKVSSVNNLVLSVSLRTGDFPVFVKIHKRTHNTNSYCKCRDRTIKHVPDYWLQNRLKIAACAHIKAVIKHIVLLDKFLTQHKPWEPSEEIIEKFSRENGRWESASLLKHKPKERGDPDYQRYVCGSFICMC